MKLKSLSVFHNAAITSINGVEVAGGTVQLGDSFEIIHTIGDEQIAAGLAMASDESAGIEPPETDKATGKKTAEKTLDPAAK